jgi:hypothetical protein
MRPTAGPKHDATMSVSNLTNKGNALPRLGRTREQRFWEKVRRVDGDGCWEWTAGVDGAGYPQLFNAPGKKPLRAHRFSYEINVGPIPEGMYVCHNCDNPRCVRPDHLFIGTHQDNIRDAKEKGRMRGPRGGASRVQS